MQKVSATYNVVETFCESEKENEPQGGMLGKRQSKYFDMKGYFVYTQHEQQQDGERTLHAWQQEMLVEGKNYN